MLPMMDETLLSVVNVTCGNINARHDGMRAILRMQAASVVHQTLGPRKNSPAFLLLGNLRGRLMLPGESFLGMGDDFCVCLLLVLLLLIM